MTGVLYLLALIAVGWLVAWTIRDPERPTGAWWPFDMKGDASVVPPHGRAAVAKRRWVLAPQTALPWRRRGADDEAIVTHDD